jgi:mono/diheme cytochrome c family protein
MMPIVQLSALGAIAVLAFAWTPALGQPAAPSANANVAAGRALSERDCIACHRQKFGTPEAIYLRPDRRVNTFAQLQAQVARCNAELPTQYFPEEEEQLVDYLNTIFYRLPR